MKKHLILWFGLMIPICAFSQDYFNLPGKTTKELVKIPAGEEVILSGYEITKPTSGFSTFQWTVLYKGVKQQIEQNQLNRIELSIPANVKDAWDKIKVQSDIYPNLFKKGFQYDLRKGLEDEAIEYIEFCRKNDLLFEDTYLEDYLQSLIYKIHPVTLNDGRPGTLNVFILKSPDPNAFILPNGSIFITTTLLSMATSEEELIGALAHEVAHFVLDHHVNNINKDLQRKQWAEFWTTLATAAAAVAETYMAVEYDYYPTGDLTIATAITAAAIANSVIQRAGAKYSIEQESEADQVAYKILEYLKIDPAAFATLLSKIHDYCYLNGQYLALTGEGTHPSLKSRIFALGIPDLSKYKKVEYDKTMSRIHTYSASVEYYLKHMLSCEVLVDRNIQAGVPTETDYLLKSAVTRALYNTPEKNQEALAYIAKAKTLNVNPTGLLYKHEGITLMRLKQYAKAVESFTKYEEEVRKLDKEIYWRDDEISWAREMIHKAKNM